MIPQPSLHQERPERLLVIVAHPDDVDFGMAGTVARWVAEGTLAQLVCCTSGDQGSDDATADPLELSATREAEQRAAADIVGFEAVTFLHRPDGALANDLALREQLVRLIRTFRPDAVATPDPRVLIHAAGMVNHVDHREAGAAAIDAVYPAAQNPMAFPQLVNAEGLQPHHVKRLYLFWTDQPSAIVDISATLETKLRALHAHRSQLRQPDGIDARIESWARSTGDQVGVAAGESFAVIDLH
jgi:LmbE family N-acetylglucosaminyl deacetylase